MTAETFEQTLDDNDIVIIDWWAQWCGPCKMFAPVFEAAAKEHPDIFFASVDTDDQQELASSSGIMSIPTLMVFRDGIGVHQQSGAMAPKAFESLIADIKALDMDEIRADLDM